MFSKNHLSRSQLYLFIRKKADKKDTASIGARLEVLVFIRAYSIDFYLYEKLYFCLREFKNYRIKNY